MADLKAAIFDIGNVVLFFSHDKMCDQLGVCFGMAAADVDACLFGSDFVSRYDRGLASTDDMFDLLAARGSRAPSIAEARWAAADIFEVNAPLQAVLSDLRRAGITLVALSNTCEVHATHVREHYGVLAGFDHLVLSHEVGIAKPDTAIFELAIQATGCAAEECFFTDDVPAYVAAARGCGMPAEVFVDAATVAEQLRMRGYSAEPRRHDSGV